MRIVALCNDRLAVPALQVLIQNRLLLAVGIPDRLSEPTQYILQLCKQSGVPVKSFSRGNFESAVSEWLEQQQPDVVLVKTFPWKIPASLLARPKHGFINFHYAPLPEFRGPSPLFWMIRNRAAEIGVTVHRMDAEFDTGDILLQKRIPLSSEFTAGMCTAQLAFVGAELTGQLLQGLHQGLLIPGPQPSEGGWYKRPLAEDLRINWKEQNAEDIVALVKACNPWAKGAPTSWNGWTFGITDARIVSYTVPDGTTPGTVLNVDSKNGLIIASRSGHALLVEVVYTEEGFFPGHRLAVFGLQTGAILGT
jgi:methionyl-tRNA formyltransferase